MTKAEKHHTPGALQSEVTLKNAVIELAAMLLTVVDMIDAAEALTEDVCRNVRAAEGWNAGSFGPWRGLEWVMIELRGKVQEVAKVAEWARETAESRG